MFGLFNRYDDVKFDIESLRCRLDEEYRENLRLTGRVKELEAQIKALNRERYKELQEMYVSDEIGTLNKVYNKYKYTRFCDAPVYVQDFVATKFLVNLFFVNLNSEKRTIGEILELSYPTINCVGCSKPEESKKEGCKCSKKKGKNKQ